ncbi:hypothetical protein CPB84DRAFT_877031 [Gymnopilus junonius]|uniref:Uncharacterized protein n=1 Tax=Gymnopilus junonius TaxID=109634 RepID=A0A9P5NSE9_GYMJU|nr:hypothetical protein CPB84DRAFT_877031 [Gymnopilus junonius]
MLECRCEKGRKREEKDDRLRASCLCSRAVRLFILDRLFLGVVVQLGVWSLALLFASAPPPPLVLSLAFSLSTLSFSIHIHPLLFGLTYGGPQHTQNQNHTKLSQYPC